MAPIAKEVEFIRSNELAHRSADVDMNDAFRRANAVRDEIELLSNNAIELANGFCKAKGLQKAGPMVQEVQRNTKRLFEARGAKFPEEDGDAFENVFGN